MPEEMIDILNSDGTPAGYSRGRTEVHAKKSVPEGTDFYFRILCVIEQSPFAFYCRFSANSCQTLELPH